MRPTHPSKLFLIERSKCNAKFCYICAAVWKTCACLLDEGQGHRGPSGEEGDTGQVFEETGEREEQRRHQAEEGRKMQEKWSRVVRTRCGRLMTEMDNLYQRQWDMLGERHRDERDEFESERILHERQRAEKLDTDMKLLGERQKGEMKKHISLQKHEHEALRKGQVTDQDEYWYSLQAHLKGKPDKEERQKALMEKYAASQTEEMHVFHQEQERKQIGRAHV